MTVLFVPPPPDRQLRPRSPEPPPVAPDLSAWQLFLLFVDEAIPGMLFTLVLFVGVWVIGLLVESCSR